MYLYLLLLMTTYDMLREMWIIKRLTRMPSLCMLFTYIIKYINMLYMQITY